MRILLHTISFLIFTMLLSACIERYFIDDDGANSAKIVIEGTITDLDEMQEIVISHSSSVLYADFLPYSGCSVQVFTSDNKVFYFNENMEKPGHYAGMIDQNSLLIGTQFQLIVTTPEGERYESSLEEMYPCPEIDSIYYRITKKGTADPDKFIDGIQFYLDFEANDYFSRFYRWSVEETYEYHSFWPIKNYYDENNHYISIVGPADYSKFICYKSELVDNLITLSTEALTKNSFRGVALNYVDDHTQRLLYHYSILVKQFSLDEKAYAYWEKTKKNNKSDAGLFTKQPGRIVGNIVNTNNTDEMVLGYFGVSSVTSKRLVVATIEEFQFKDMLVCKPAFLKYTPLPWEPRPIYLFNAVDPADGTWSAAFSVAECVDCTSLGGVVEKPDFFN